VCLNDLKRLPPTGDLFVKFYFIVKIKNMKEFIKENWFKIALIIMLSIGVVSYALNQYIHYQKQIQTQVDKEKKGKIRQIVN